MQYCLLREALNITQILFELFFSLIMVHRDYCTSQTMVFPFLPWLHSTKPCKHVFGLAQQVVKDFTYGDFLHLERKLHLKLWEVVKLGEASNP